MESEMLNYFNDTSLGVAVVDSAFRLREINKSFCFILQKQKEYLLDKDLTWFIPPLKSLSLNKNHEFQIFNLDNGQALALDIIRLKKTKGADYLIFCQDQTQYHQLLEQIEQLNQKNLVYEKMFNVLYDGIYVTDGQGIALYVNDAFYNLTGLQTKDVVGKSIYQQLEEGIIPNSCAALVLRTKKPASTISNYAQGRNCLVTGTPVFVGEELKRVICVMHDVTELQAIKEKLAKVTSFSSSLKQHLREIEVKTENKFVLETRSKIMKSIYDKAAMVAPLDTPVLILGETGVGKDFLVKFIHNLPERKDSVLMKINCGAIPEHLLESELFGYEPGAFTGASRQGKPGLFELAYKGTLYLDEIGDMPLSLQVKFLDVLQEKAFYRLGGTKQILLGARIIAATNVDLEKAIAAGKFRRDLYYRLNVISIKLPPLRQRIDDIIPLSMLFLERFNKKYNRSRYFAPHTIELLLNYDWPGNVREIENIIERLVIISPVDCIDSRLFLEQVASADNQFNAYLHGARVAAIAPPVKTPQSLKEAIDIYEESFIRDTLKKHANLRDSAQALGIDLSTLVRKKQKYKI